MKKIIIIALAVLLCGTAYASKFEVSGSAVMKGKYWSNLANDTEADSTSYYDFDFNIYPKFVVDENNFAMLKIAMKDIKPGADETFTADEQDENIAVERAFFQTKIGPTALSLGLMDGGAWASDFANSTSGVWRVKAVTTTPVGALVTVLQKNDENYTNTSNSKDNDVYYLGLITKAGPMMIKPLLVYADYNTHALGTFVKTAFQLGMDGTFGDMSLEFDFTYASQAFDDNDTLDNTVMGLYLHAAMKMGDNTAGAMILYGSVDETDSGRSFGQDFGDDAAFLTILDDEKEYGKTGSVGAGAGGLTVIALYYSAKVSDALTITPKFGYVMSNFEENAIGPDGSAIGSLDTAMELDIDCSYKINDAVSYNVALAYAQVANFTGDDPDPIYTLQHNVKISF